MALDIADIVSGVESFTPVPANEIDSNPVARVVALNESGSNTGIDLYSVTKNPTTGEPVFPAGSTIKVPAYNIPPSAPQKGTSDPLDTSDARMTQAVGAVDPGHSGKFAVWTQHTIAGGAGAMVRWYEIDPVAKTLLQSGSVSSASLFYFNAAISPDRVVRGTTHAFGSNMLLTFNASSSSTFESIQMVSKRGASSISAPKMVKASTGADADFTCPSMGGIGISCRWGDYAGATPDPNSPTTGPTGIVWATSMWTLAGNGTGFPSWRTWNWKSQP